MSVLLPFLVSQPLLKVIQSILFSSKPRHLRDIAKEHKLSASGVSDIIRRLKKIGVLQEKRSGNKRKLSLEITPEERECLHSFFQESKKIDLKIRALKFSKNAPGKLAWMDEAYIFYHKLKHHDHSSKDA